MAKKDDDCVCNPNDSKFSKSHNQARSCLYHAQILKSMNFVFISEPKKTPSKSKTPKKTRPKSSSKGKPKKSGSKSRKRKFVDTIKWGLSEKHGSKINF